jgi:hypothetical protein
VAEVFFLEKMKDLANLRQQLAYRPFRPFWLETIAGTRIRVLRAEWFVEVPSRTSFVVFDEGFVTVGRFSELTELVQIEQPKSANDHDA